MDTLTTVESIAKTPSGAFAVTMLGGTVAGTFDEEIAEVAKQAMENDDPVGVTLSKTANGKLLLEKVAIIQPPEELGGPADEPEKVEETPAQAEETAPADEPKNCEFTAADHVRRAHVIVNDIVEDLSILGIALGKLDDVAMELARAAKAVGDMEDEMAAMIPMEQA